MPGLTIKKWITYVKYTQLSVCITSGWARTVGGLPKSQRGKELCKVTYYFNNFMRYFVIFQKFKHKTLLKDWNVRIYWGKVKVTFQKAFWCFVVSHKWHQVLMMLKIYQSFFNVFVNFWNNYNFHKGAFKAFNCYFLKFLNPSCMYLYAFALTFLLGSTTNGELRRDLMQMTRPLMVGKFSQAYV